ncbi:MAG: hypothetical protein J7M38_11800 [Armatimonadetes bacterium]|nr:hypothetical protein [Armatimonadota bacterium]
MALPKEVTEPLGAAPHPIDQTGRLTLRKDEAAAMRRAIGVGDKEPFNLIVTEDTDDCLVLFTSEQWSTFADAVMQLPTMDPMAKELRRKYIGPSQTVTVDRQDRVKLPVWLLSTVALTPGESHAVLINRGDAYELWEINAYRRHRDEVREAVKEYERTVWGLAGAEAAESSA